jgi:hypothetical protein
LAAAALAAATAALATAAQAAPVFSNGGSQYWVAFDPVGRTLGNVQFLTKRISVLNTSAVANAITIYYEPQHILFCQQTLQPGQMTICGQMSSPQMVNGYFQVVAAQPVIVGGSSDTPVMNFSQDPQGNFIADPSHGTVFAMPFDWQPGCPPRGADGCPTGDLVAGPPAGSGITRGFQAQH